jgi:hypothetical protein
MAILLGASGVAIAGSGDVVQREADYRGGLETLPTGRRHARLPPTESRKALHPPVLSQVAK